MKQVIIELDEDVHAALKDRAKKSLRKIPAQLLYEALQYADKIVSAKSTAKPARKGAKAA